MLSFLLILSHILKNLSWLFGIRYIECIYCSRVGNLSLNVRASFSPAVETNSSKRSNFVSDVSNDFRQFPLYFHLKFSKLFCLPWPIVRVRKSIKSQFTLFFILLSDFRIATTIIYLFQTSFLAAAFLNWLSIQDSRVSTFFSINWNKMFKLLNNNSFQLFKSVVEFFFIKIVIIFV